MAYIPKDPHPAGLILTNREDGSIVVSFQREGEVEFTDILLSKEQARGLQSWLFRALN